MAVGLLLLHLYRQSAQAQAGRAEAVVARACDLIADRFAFFAAGWNGRPSDLDDPALRAGLARVVGLALADQDAVEGGVWQAAAGPLAYAFPTYQGTGPKTDLPQAERARIAEVNQQAARDDQPAARRIALRAQTLLLRACPLTAAISGLTAWTMTRVATGGAFQPVLLGLGVLLAMLLGMAAWLGRMLLVWGRSVGRIEQALAAAGADWAPALPPTGERELDRIVGALNEAGRRLAEARRQADAMAARAARAERLAALGRVAAGVAHEIRNPIAAARLQGENGLAGDDARRAAAITDMLGQLDRLDGLAGELLAMTQRPTPHPVPVALDAFLAGCAAQHAPLAAARGVAIRRAAASGTVRLDPAMAGRILDNLLSNAVRHTPAGGQVTLEAQCRGGTLAIVVEDSGAGVAPDLAGSLFEPFVTGRADGTGLGLAIARELAEAHGGHLSLRRAGGAAPGQGAAFVLELPQGSGCPPS